MKTNHALVLLCAAASVLGAAAFWPRSSITSGTPGIRTAIAGDAKPLANTTPPETPATLQPAAPVPTSATHQPDTDRILADIAATTDPAVQEMVERLLAASTSLDKGLAADALATHGSWDAVANLLRLAALHNDADRAAILDGLGNLHTAAGFQSLATMISATRDPQILEAAFLHLARTDDPSVLDLLLEQYRERNDLPMQKNHALQAIAALRHPGYSRALNKLTRAAPEPALAEAAGTALAAIQGAALPEK